MLRADPSMMRWLVWIVSALALGRALHSLWYLVIALLAREGEAVPLGTTALIAETLSRLSALQYLVWTSYTLAYLAIIPLVFLGRRVVLFVAIYAVAADFGYWIWSGTATNFASLVSTGPVLSDAIINLVALSILIGVLSLFRYWANQRDDDEGRSGLKTLQQVVAVVIILRGLYAVLLFLSVFAFKTGIANPLSIGSHFADFVQALQIWLFLPWGAYVFGYLIAGFFAYRGRLMGLWIYLGAMFLDFSLWIYSSMSTRIDLIWSGTAPAIEIAFNILDLVLVGFLIILMRMGRLR